MVVVVVVGAGAGVVVVVVVGAGAGVVVVVVENQSDPSSGAISQSQSWALFSQSSIMSFGTQMAGPSIHP